METIIYIINQIIIDKQQLTTEAMFLKFKIYLYY